MNEDCIDDTITVNAYSMIGNGTYFATMTTPDVYTMFISELTREYMRRDKLDRAEAEKKAERKSDRGGHSQTSRERGSGGQERENHRQRDDGRYQRLRGRRVHKAPNAALAFVDLATSYEMIMKRNQLLGIAPPCGRRRECGRAFGDRQQKSRGGAHRSVPSVRAIAQVWTPAQTFFSDLAKDPFRPKKDQKYTVAGRAQNRFEKSGRPDLRGDPHARVKGEISWQWKISNIGSAAKTQGFSRVLKDGNKKVAASMGLMGLGQICTASGRRGSCICSRKSALSYT